ncbi:MAG TPA: ABC transporter permease [Vicinamibacterales bacterium]|nr:ABC transporter permease [Vicinamibacterales bacterium]
MDAVFQDIRYAIRLCVRSPGFTVVAVVALALGIGANTAIFTIVNAALIERLPYKNPERLVAVWEGNSRRPGRANVVAPANYLRWRERATSFEDMAGLVDTRLALTGNGAPEELTVQNVTSGFFPILGVQPLIGRTFSDAEYNDRNSPAVVLAYPLWQRRFGGDPSIVGKALQLNGAPLTVVGIMPPDFQLQLRSNSLVGRPTDLWRPWWLSPEAREPRGRFMSVIARLKPGISLERAQTQMDTIAAGLTAELPQFDTGWTVRVLSMRDELSRDFRPALLVLSGAVAFVLLIACANVANLLLARAAVRQREIAVRTALGAPRRRLIRQLLTESLVLAALGGLAGLIVARWGLDVLLAISPIDVSAFNHLTLSYAVLAFTAIVSMMTAVICGFAPAFESSRADVQEALKDGARQVGGARGTRLRHSFVVAEIALAVVLLVGAGLMLRTFASLQSVNTGLDTTNVITMRVSLPNRKYDDAKTLRFFQDAARRVAAIPGVQSAGIVSYLPFAGLGAATRITIVGQPPPAPGQDLTTDVSVCDNGYLQTVRVPLLKGRLFTEREMREKSNVVLINEALARQYFPGTDPIGQRVVINMTDLNVPTEIIGIVGNTKFTDVRADSRPTSYWPHPQLEYSSMTIAARTAGDPQSFAATLEREIHALDPDQPVADVRTMDQWVAKSLAQARFNSLLLATFAAVALLLAAVGIYGVMSYAVSQRTAEIGIRLAIGADRGDILRMILANAARLAAIGLAAGIALALALSRTVTSLLYKTSGTDPLTFAAVAAVLAGVALAASYIPARRAARIPPVDALRYQ